MGCRLCRLGGRLIVWNLDQSAGQRLYQKLLRSVKYEVVYPGDFRTGAELQDVLESYFGFDNFHRPLQAF